MYRELKDSDKEKESGKMVGHNLTHYSTFLPVLFWVKDRFKMSIRKKANHSYGVFFVFFFVLICRFLMFPVKAGQYDCIFCLTTEKHLFVLCSIINFVIFHLMMLCQGGHLNSACHMMANRGSLTFTCSPPPGHVWTQHQCRWSLWWSKSELTFSQSEQWDPWHSQRSCTGKGGLQPECLWGGGCPAAAAHPLHHWRRFHIQSSHAAGRQA